MFKSNAKWTKTGNSSDTHDDLNFAITICDILVNDYNRHSPCPTRGVCVESYVTDENNNIVYTNRNHIKR